MKKRNFMMWGAAMLTLCGVLTACSGKDDVEDNTPAPPPSETGTDTGKAAAFYGIVSRAGQWGGAARQAGVTVRTGNLTTTTDANGYYQFETVAEVQGRAVLTFEKEGFMTVVRSVPMQKTMRLDVMLKEKTSQTFASSSEQTITLKNIDYSRSMLIALPADCYVTESGDKYEGSVTAEAVYLDPDDENFATQMPGDLSAIRLDQSEAQLVSYGMVAVELKGASGEKLNLAPGQKATVTFPIPNSLKDNTPATIPLWSFNEETGLWEEEGLAERYGGDYYKGEVSHFSWHNLDAPELKATVNITVKDAAGKALADVPVDIGGQRTFYTDKEGKLKCDIPSNCDVYLRVPSDVYGNYAGSDPTKEVKTTINLSGGETRSVTLTIPAAGPTITGTVVNTGVGSKICNVLLSYYNPESWWEQTAPVITDLQGNFRIYAPAGITGSAMLIATFADGTSFTQDFQLTGTDQTVNITVNSDSNSGTGVVTVWNDRLGIKASYTLSAPKTGTYWEVAQIEGDRFSAGFSTQDKAEIDWESGETVDMVDFWLTGYSPSQTHFTNAFFHFMREGGPHLNINANGEADITLKDGIYTIKMTGVSGSYSDQMKGIEQSDVKVSLEYNVKAEK